MKNHQFVFVLALSFLAPVFALASGPVSQLAILDPAQSLALNATSSVITVESQDNTGALAEATSTIRVNLTSSSATGLFAYSPASGPCNNDWSNTRTLAIASSTAHKSFCYKDSTAGTFTITASADSLVTGTQPITINPPLVAVTGVTLDQPTLTLVVGGSAVTLRSTVLPAGATNQNVTWSSSNPTVASVDASGIVSPLSAGTASITVTTADGGFVATSSVAVNEVVKSHSSGFLPGWGPNGRINGQVLGASTSRGQELARQHQLKVITRKLRLIKRHLALIRHPELANLNQIEVDSTSANLGTKTDSALNTNPASSTSTTTLKKSWWQILW